MAEPTPPSPLMPVAVLVVIVLAMAGGWWAFPRIQASMARSDCQAAGHINCG